LIVAGALALWQPISESPFQTLPMPGYYVPSVLKDSTAALQSLGSLNESSENYSFWQHSRTATSTVANLGIALYGVHADLLIIASLLLLVAMVGAVG